MTIVGLWIAIVGYGLAYSGYVQLGGGKCSLVTAFQGKCQPTGAGGPGTGMTQAQAASAGQRQQAGLLSTQPIAQGAA